MIKSESPTTAMAKSSFERIPPLGRKIVLTMGFVGLVGVFLTSSGTPAHLASKMLLTGGALVPMGLVAIHRNLPKWEWIGHQIERLAFIWMVRFAFVIAVIAFVQMAIQLANTLLAS